MLQDKVTIKQIADDSASRVGLNKYGRSKMPLTRDFLCPAEYGGRYITGLDEDAIQVEMIQDEKEKSQKKKEIKALREKLGKQMNKDLSGTSEFWADFGVSLSADQDLVLTRSNPQHVISYHVLVANGYAAPSLDDAGQPEYRNAKYYVYSEKVQQKESVTIKKKRAKADAKLLEISNNKDMMLLIGQFLEGPKYTLKHDEEDLYSMIDAFIHKDPENIDKFLRATAKGAEELQFKLIIDSAIRNKIIKWDKKYYQRGQVTLGKNIEEVFDNLRSPQYAAEFMSIKQELDDERSSL